VTVRRILTAGAVVGLLDGAFAVSLCYIYATTCLPYRVFQGIAAGVLSREPALAGGAATTALGVVLHLFIATSWATVYGVLYERWAALRRLTASPLGVAAAATVFGMLVWVVMNRAVTPLSYARPTPLFAQVWWVILLGHPVVVGLPLAGIIRARAAQPA
jgi:hypothetical protein